MSAPPPTPKDGFQVLKYAFDDASGRIRTDAVISPSGSDIEVDHTEDSIAIGTPTALFTSTTVGADVGLDVNIIGGELQIEVSAADGDNIAISDGTNTLAINPDGSINVNTGAVTGTVVTTYNEVTSIPASTPTTLETYTVPVATTARLQQISVSGTNIATYTVLINAAPIDKRRTYFSGDLNLDFVFSTDPSMGIPLTTGDVVSVTVVHNRPYTGDFNARIQVIEE